MIGLLIPGFPIIIRGPIMTTNIVVDINNPKDINNISIFLTEPIANDYGAALIIFLLIYFILDGVLIQV